MYINDVHILIYVSVGIVGLIVGQFIDWCNKRLPEYEKCFCKELFTKYLANFKPNYMLMIIMAVIYIGLLYILGLNVEFVKFAVLTPMLVSAFIIDYKLQIIPNRLNLTIFEVGLVFTFLAVVLNTNVGIELFIDSILGMIVGGGVFLFITLLGGLIAGKEAMGFGDVKLMGALGLFFGWKSILIVSVLSFLIAAIVSIGVLIFRKRKINEYIPFGPFIVISSFITMFVPEIMLLSIVLKIFTLGMYNG